MRGRSLDPPRLSPRVRHGAVLTCMPRQFCGMQVRVRLHAPGGGGGVVMVVVQISAFAQGSTWMPAHLTLFAATTQATPGCVAAGSPPSTVHTSWGATSLAVLPQLPAGKRALASRAQLSPQPSCAPLPSYAPWGPGSVQEHADVGPRAPAPAHSHPDARPNNNARHPRSGSCHQASSSASGLPRQSWALADYRSVGLPPVPWR